MKIIVTQSDREREREDVNVNYSTTKRQGIHDNYFKVMEIQQNLEGTP